MIEFLSIQSNFSLLFSFLLGIGVGIGIFSIFYLIVVLSSIKKKNFIIKSKGVNISDDEIKELIEKAESEFFDKDLKGKQSNVSYCKDICFDLVINIASKFFPYSKHPLYELSIDEVLMLTVYISKRLDEILDRKSLRLFRSFKVSTIVGFTEVKEKIEANSIVKATKKYKLFEALNAAKKVINVINPIYWTRKFIIDKSFSIMIKKLCKMTIGIVGEETYKIYSKAVFDKKLEIDTGVEDIALNVIDDLNKTKENISEKDLDNINDIVIKEE